MLDTYARGYAPEETLIDGLEGSDLVLLTEGGFPLYDYAREDADDPRISEGDGAAWIEIDDGGWTTVAVMELSQNATFNSIIGGIAPEDRVHYTLSYDFVIVPDPNTAVSWFQFLPSATGLRLTPNWVGSEVRRTTSVNLASVAWADPAPNINLVSQGGFDGYVDVFIDNVRVFNAKGVQTGKPEPLEAPALGSAQISGGQFELIFSSVSGGSYTILSSDDIASGNWSEVASGVRASGNSTFWQADIHGAQKFYRVRRDN